MLMKKKTILPVLFILTILVVPVITPAEYITSQTEGKDILLSSNANVQIIYVDDNYNQSTPGWNVTRFATVRAGLRAVPEHGVLYVYNGTYNENCLVVNKSISLVGQNTLGTIIDGSSGGDTLTITADYVKIRSITIKNNRRCVSALVIRSGYDTITQTSIQNIGYGIVMKGGVGGGNTRNNTIIGNTFISTGITIFGDSPANWGSHRIERNTVNGKPLYYYKNAFGIRVPRDAGQIILVNCSSIYVSGVKISDSQRAVQVAFCHDITIRRNEFWNEYASLYDESSCGIYMCSSRNILMVENVIFGYKTGIYLVVVANSMISGNTLMQNIHGFYSYCSSLLSIMKNMFMDNAENSIILSETIGAQVVGNTIRRSLFGIVLLYHSHQNVIKDSVINDMMECGIYFGAACGQNSIIKNVITNNTNGVILFVDSDENTVSGNTIAYNTFGMTLQGANWNQVFENDIIQNSAYGVQLVIQDEGWQMYGSNWNLLYHNNFINNTQQAYDECYNYWDNESLQEGNYWSDYQGVDINPPVGIGDTPYTITGMEPPNQDHYPFMKQNGWMI